MLIIGAALFDWDADDSVLRGRGPTELRFHKAPVVDELVRSGGISQQWKDLICDTSLVD